MKILKFYQNENLLKVKVEIFEDLWSLQRVIFSGDAVKSKSVRRFKANESDVGELKDVMVTVVVEKTELDKTAQRLRIAGKIVDGSPLEYIRLGSYHTINVAAGDVIDIIKLKWPDYLLSVVRNAVSESRRPLLGIIAVDDEKALPAYLLAYGIEFRNEIYSNLSKKMSQKDFQEQLNKYFDAIVNEIKDMAVDTVIVAGPGFTKDDVQKYMQSKGIEKTLNKRLIFESTSNAERSGVYELIKSDKTSSLLEKERIRAEFILMEKFLHNLSIGLHVYGIENVSDAIGNYAISMLLVNDGVLGDPQIQKALAEAEQKGIHIEVFNSSDEAGQQLHAFKDIAGI
ncbi:MAG: mRNA surveillance protein pelota [Candidatus Micrarchaeales archaeon]|jgi:protein pelota|uniref:Translation factor pelota n=1 Tax=Candidatus Micrarchaeum acidiphilum ARMAN-2 TaxID=425595 RepID=C7DHQ5_MICA2|nr:MAG: translation factor pelota [Candidatus Micrarchaeum acidiphilum ARMAN-2]MCW6160726.1 mRNA surveillance protein pelota [Candidatus Micrarchaeales archaeon]